MVKYRDVIVLSSLICIGLIITSIDVRREIYALKVLIKFIVSPSFAVTDTFSNITSRIGSLIETTIHYDSIRREREEFLILKKTYELTRRENEILRKMLEFKEKSDYKLVFAEITSRSIQEGIVTINKGKKSGIEINTPVITFASDFPTAFGRVIEVYPNSSKLALITNPFSHLVVRIKNKDTEGVIESAYGRYVSMRYILPYDSVEIGDIVVTSPTSEVFPADIYVGVVVDVKTHEDFKTALVRLFHNPNFVERVVCIAR